MRKKFFFVLSLTLLLLPGAPLGAQQPPPQNPPPTQQEQGSRIIITSDFVNVVFTVVNRRQKFVTDLEKGNFKIFEDNALQNVQLFGRETDLPLRVGVLMDTSNSIRDRFKFEQEAAIDFFSNVLRRKKDLAFLMTVDAEPAVVQEFTDDAGRLSEVVQKQRPGGGTALYDGIYRACKDYLAKAPLASGENPEVRRILVVISDGDDSMSDRTRRQAIEMAQRAEVAIYAISTSVDWLSITGDKPQKIHKSEGDELLQQLADETGGRAFFPYRRDDLAQSFQDITDELRSQYSIGYVPTNRRNEEGKFRVIKIELVDRKGLIVRSRRGYFTPRIAGRTSATPAAIPKSQ
ncbi:MAG: VWA domain-containing protein [Acidobacteria bacterium]|nr:VWA domain-containing protein [Acidobacteriota bacterium]